MNINTSIDLDLELVAEAVIGELASSRSVTDLVTTVVDDSVSDRGLVDEDAVRDLIREEAITEDEARDIAETEVRDAISDIDTGVSVDDVATWLQGEMQSIPPVGGQCSFGRAFSHAVYVAIAGLFGGDAEHVEGSGEALNTVRAWALRAGMPDAAPESAPESAHLRWGDIPGADAWIAAEFHRHSHRGMVNAWRREGDDHFVVTLTDLPERVCTRGEAHALLTALNVAEAVTPSRDVV